MRDRLLRIYWRMQRRIAPGLKYSQSHYEDVLDETVRAGCAWLDVGCGHQVLPPWRLDSERALVDRAKLVVGVDPDFPSLRRHATFRFRAVATLDDLPFPRHSFDIVTANMVAEHLEHPETQFAEIARVLRPGGLFVFHTPNKHSYTTRLARLMPDAVKRPVVRLLEGRTGGDVYPTFYRVNTEERIRAVASQAGLDVVDVRAVTSSAEFATVPPLAFIELLWLRRVMQPGRSAQRQTFIGMLAKPQTSKALAEKA